MVASRTGGEILVANLIAQGVDLAFGVPGESYLAVLDALADVGDRLRFIVCRQEGGAAYMAEAYGKLTRRPGIAFVTRGPGASNAAIGIHTALQDSTPLVLFVGQVGGAMVDREAFQEVDYRRMYGSLAKWVAQIDRAERIPEYVAHAFRTAMSGRPGPVVLALPEDMLTSRAAVVDAPRVEPIEAAASAAAVAEAHAMLAAATRPLVIVGGSRWTPEAHAALARFATIHRLPVACAFRRQELFDHRDPHYAGDVGIAIDPALATRVRNADVLLVLGERLGEITTGGYTLLAVPNPTQRLIHVHPSPDELGRVYQPALPIAATPHAFLAAALALPAFTTPARTTELATIAAEREASRKPRTVPGAVDLWRIALWLDERLPADAIITNGAGNYTTWLHRLYRYRSLGSQLAPYSGAMGYGVPAAVAAKLVHPERPVLAWNGDGCFLMNGQELATAVQYGLGIVFVVIDNGMYGTIRMHQERRHPGRVSGTSLRNPDFAMLARAYGATGETVEETAQFAPAFERALASTQDGVPALLHVKVDPEALTMGATLAALRAQGEAARQA